MTLNQEGLGRSGRDVTRFIPVPTSVSEPAQKFLQMDMFGGGADRLDRAISQVGGKDQATDELLVAVMGHRSNSSARRFNPDRSGECPYSWSPRRRRRERW